MPWYFTIYHTILALGVVTGAIRFRTLSRTSRYAFLLIILTLLVEITAWILAHLIHNNLIVYRSFAIIQFCLISAMYKQELGSYRILILVFVCVVLTVALVDFIVNFSVLLQQYPTIVKSICSLFIIVLALLYLNKLLTIRVMHSFVGYPLFWLSMGWLLFSIITLFNLSAYNFIAKYESDYLILFERIRITANWILYSLFTVAFLSKQYSINE